MSYLPLIYFPYSFLVIFSSPSIYSLGITSYYLELLKFDDEENQEVDPFLITSGFPIFEDGSSLFKHGNHSVVFSLKFMVKNLERTSSLIKNLVNKSQLQDRWVNVRAAAHVCTYIYGFPICITHSKNFNLNLGSIFEKSSTTQEINISKSNFRVNSSKCTIFSDFIAF